MAVVLGVDAAWTAHGSSGVALVTGEPGAWRCLRVAPGYAAFTGGSSEVGPLLDAARRIAGAPVDVVAIDMPVARVPFEGRRFADNEISRVFGGRGCSAHSPLPHRPGPFGRELTAELARRGYPVHTEGAWGSHGCAVEVYPHPALLALLGRARRVPYKVQKSRTYWPDRDARQRIEALLDELGAIHAALERELGPVRVSLPRAGDVARLASLKPLENSLDALVCAWVGTRFVAGRVTAYGDADASIFCPNG